MSVYWQLYNILKILWQTVAWGILFTLPVLAGILFRPNSLVVIKHKINYCWLLMYNTVVLIWAALFYINSLWCIRCVNAVKNIFRHFWLQRAFAFLQLSALVLLVVIYAKKYGNHFVLNGPAALAFTCMGIMLAAIVYRLVKAGKYIVGYAGETIVESGYLKAGLAMQQSNVKPYFFTAGLMNIHTLTLKKMDQQNSLPHKFYEVSKYILHEPTVNRIALEKEIEHLKNYIETQQHRFKNKVSLVVSPDIKEGLYEVKPMVLIPFIEKAFNYKKEIPLNSRVEITLNEKKNMLCIIVTGTEKSSFPQQILQQLTPHKNDASVRRKLLINCHTKTV